MEGRGRSATRSSGTISGRAASAGGASSASYNISQPFDSATPSMVRRWTSMLRDARYLLPLVAGQ